MISLPVVPEKTIDGYTRFSISFRWTQDYPIAWLYKEVALQYGDWRKKHRGVAGALVWEKWTCYGEYGVYNEVRLRWLYRYDR